MTASTTRPRQPTPLKPRTGLPAGYNPAPGRLSGPLLTAAYISTVPAASLLITIFGAVPIGPGLTAPAGVFLAGIALVLRDLVRETLGPAVALAAVLAGGALSWWLADPELALASTAAFLLSELLDTAVYEPMRHRGLVTAMALSNTVGLVVDSVLFLALAEGSLTHLPGQVLGKAAMTAVAIVSIALVSRPAVTA